MATKRTFELDVVLRLIACFTVLGTLTALAACNNAPATTQLTKGDGFITGLSPSDDGRLIVFSSTSSNLVPNDDNGAADVFVVDRVTRSISKISIGTYGAYGPSISGDGRFVSYTANTSADPDTPTRSIFLADRRTGTTTPLPNSNSQVSESMFQPSGESTSDLNADGGFVAFSTGQEVFRYEAKTGTTTKLSTEEGSTHPSISADGSVVVFGNASARADGSPTQSVVMWKKGKVKNITVALDVAYDKAQVSANGETVIYSSKSATGFRLTSWNRLTWTTTPLAGTEGRQLASVSGDGLTFLTVGVQGSSWSALRHVGIRRSQIAGGIGSAPDAAMSANGSLAVLTGDSDDKLGSVSDEASDLFAFVL